VETVKGAWRWALPILLLLYLGLALAHASLVPTGETGYQNAPDEAAHVVYARTVARGHLPTQRTMAGDPHGYEWHQPPLYYCLAACFVPLGERAMRLASILCGLAGILLIYQAGRLLFPNDPLLATVAAGIAALTPGHIAITSTVNNDALLEVCFSGALLVLIGALRSGFTTARAIWLGIALGAAILTKLTGLLLLPVLALAFLLLWRADEAPRLLRRGAAWTALIALTLSGWWFVRNHQLYGEWLPLHSFQLAFGGTAQAGDMVAGLGGSWGRYLLLVTQWTFQSFWAAYGSPQTARTGLPLFLPPQLYLLLAGVCLAALVGLARLHLRRKTCFTETQRLALSLLFATNLVVTMAFLAFILRYFQTQGRYLYPAMLALCLVLALGWRAVFPPRYAPLASGMLLALLAAIALGFLRYVAP
jgi:4-amino-4-deoxy-L-arabinose transferase-like glycosyltransferase